MKMNMANMDCLSLEYNNTPEVLILNVHNIRRKVAYYAKYYLGLLGTVIITIVGLLLSIIIVPLLYILMEYVNRSMAKNLEEMKKMPFTFQPHKSEEDLLLEFKIYRKLCKMVANLEKVIDPTIPFLGKTFMRHLELMKATKKEAGRLLYGEKELIDEPVTAFPSSWAEGWDSEEMDIYDVAYLRGEYATSN